MLSKYFQASLVVILLVPCTKSQPAGDSTPVTLTELLTSLKQNLPHTCDSTTLVTRLLVEEIEERIKKQTQADMKISQLESQLADKANDEPVVAFSAQVETHLRGLTPQQTIPFGRVLTNLGGAFNSDTSIFRCPVNGLYQFVVTILSEKNSRIETQMMAGGKSAMLLYSGGITYNGAGSNSVLLSLKEGDSVYVRVHLSLGDKVHGVWSTFSGHLVRKL